jgi:mono/diheme cytochrome c family protein
MGPVERGSRLAAELGCNNCHAAPYGAAVAFAEMQPNEDSVIRQWILRGLPDVVRQDPDRLAGAESAPIRMPSYRRLLDEKSLDALVSFVRATAGGANPIDQRALRGQEIAQRSGCFGCHGPEGRGDRPNPGSLKGYIPGWAGSDFAELARSEDEIREWINDGTPYRLRVNPIAVYFTERQIIKMPAFRKHLTPAEVDDVIAYIAWLRAAPAD